MPTGCVFCRIIAGEQPAAFVYENEQVAAFLDINQIEAGHTLVVPRVHVPFWWELSDEDVAAVTIAAKPIMQGLCEVFQPPGMLVEQRNGRAAGQEVFHMHLHLIPKGGQRGKPFSDLLTLQRRAAQIRAALRHILGPEGP